MRKRSVRFSILLVILTLCLGFGVSFVAPKPVKADALGDFIQQLSLGDFIRGLFNGLFGGTAGDDPYVCEFSNLGDCTPNCTGGTCTSNGCSGGTYQCVPAPTPTICTPSAPAKGMAGFVQQLLGQGDGSGNTCGLTPTPTTPILCSSNNCLSPNFCVNTYTCVSPTPIQQCNGQNCSPPNTCGFGGGLTLHCLTPTPIPTVAQCQSWDLRNCQDACPSGKCEQCQDGWLTHRCLPGPTVTPIFGVTPGPNGCNLSCPVCSQGKICDTQGCRSNLVKCNNPIPILTATPTLTQCEFSGLGAWASCQAGCGAGNCTSSGCSSGSYRCSSPPPIPTPTASVSCSDFGGTCMTGHCAIPGTGVAQPPGGFTDCPLSQNQYCCLDYIPTSTPTIIPGVCNASACAPMRCENAFPMCYNGDLYRCSQTNNLGCCTAFVADNCGSGGCQNGQCLPSPTPGCSMNSCGEGSCPSGQGCVLCDNSKYRCGTLPTNTPRPSATSTVRPTATSVPNLSPTVAVGPGTPPPSPYPTNTSVPYPTQPPGPPGPPAATATPTTPVGAPCYYNVKLLDGSGNPLPSAIQTGTTETGGCRTTGVRELVRTFYSQPPQTLNNAPCTQPDFTVGEQCTQGIVTGKLICIAGPLNRIKGCYNVSTQAYARINDTSLTPTATPTSPPGSTATPTQPPAATPTPAYSSFEAWFTIFRSYVDGPSGGISTTLTHLEDWRNNIPVPTPTPL